MLPNTQRFFDELGALGYTGTIDDRLHAFLRTELGVTGSVGDLLNRYLAGLGYTGSLADKIAAFIASGDDLAPSFDPVTALFGAGEKGYILDPSDFSTMFQDSAGTVPVTAVGQPVGRILDISGNNWHFHQPTDADRPVLAQDANGNYYLSTNGTNQFMLSTTANVPALQRATVVAGTLYIYNPSATVQGMDANAGATGSTAWSTWWESGAGLVARTHDGATSQIAAEITSGNRYVVSTTHNLNGASVAARVSLRLNGAATGTHSGSFSGVNSKFITTNYHYIGKFFNYRLKGGLYRRVVRYAISTADEIASTEEWVNSKTGAY